MDLAKAVAIYLYEQSKPPGMRNERLLSATWQVIASVGEDESATSREVARRWH